MTTEQARFEMDRDSFEDLEAWNQRERALKGNQLAQLEGQVQRVNDSEYRVHSQKSDSWYQVYATERGLERRHASRPSRNQDRGPE